MFDWVRFWDVVCEYQYAMRLLVAILVMMTALLAFAFPFLEPGTGAYVIALIDVVLLVFAFLVVGGVTLGCARREA